MNNKTISKVLKILRKRYNDKWHEKTTPYKTLVSCLISLRTKDEVTYPASERLFKLAKNPEEMVKLSTKQIEKAIYPAGFYKTKAKRIKEISKKLLEEYNGEVPDDIDELLKFRGIGRKTANIVVTYGFNKLGIAVDTHVHRLSNRFGYVKTKNPEETEFALRKKLPKRYWIDFNELLVRHGQNICKPITPKCSICPINKYCEKVNVKRFK